jgi:hypothetical protein
VRPETQTQTRAPSPSAGSQTLQSANAAIAGPSSGAALRVNGGGGSLYKLGGLIPRILCAGTVSWYATLRSLPAQDLRQHEGHMQQRAQRVLDV